MVRAFPAPLHHNREPDRELEEYEERHGLERERDRVDSWQQHGRQNDEEDPDPAVPAQPVGGQDAEADERQDEDRQLEHEAHPEQDHRDEAVVVARPDLNVVELAVVVRQEREAARQEDEVAEGRPHGEETRSEQDEDRDHPLRVLLERGSEKAPELVEHDRQRDGDARVEADLDRGEERLRDAERDERLVVRERLREPAEDPLLKGERDRERDGDRAERDEQPRPELAEVLDEGRLFAVCEAPGKPGHVPRRSRARALRRPARPRRQAARAPADRRHPCRRSSP